VPLIKIVNNYPEGQRLDLFLTKELHQRLGPEAPSRSQIKLLIENGAVVVTGKTTKKAGQLVPPDARVEINFDSPTAASKIKPLALELPVLYEDRALIVIDKPHALTMHPGAGTKDDTLVNALLHRWSKLPEIPRAGIVHRLDRDTSGVVVVAKTLKAHEHLSAQFAKRTVNRFYSALVLTSPRSARFIPPEPGQESIIKPDGRSYGVIDAPIGRSPTRRTQMAIVAGGRAARTHWWVVERFKHGALLKLKLETGRTHQIRVHLNSINAPVIGDQTYGNFSSLPATLKRLADEFGRQALHASYLDFEHPKTGERLKFNSAIPADLEQLITKFREE
jgi:23S rRNA pseudouridine1911/1915/1917 synthase